MEDLVTAERLSEGTSDNRNIHRSQIPMKVLLTGAEGYIGSVLAPMLLSHGFEATGLDTGFYRAGWLYNDAKDKPAILSRDVRNITAKDLEGYDAVLHLAELSNDPLCEQDPEKTFAINHRASVALAKAAKDAGVVRFIYTSSCSIYGAGGADMKTEESAPNPQTAYARCKELVEKDVRPMADAYFSPTFLRNATAFGISPRMRFDIVLNNLAGLAWTTHKISMSSDGTPWRPLVHVQDICDAIIAVLDAPRDDVCGEILNVGDESHNYTVKEIAEAVAEAFPGCKLEFGDNGADNRSYRVDFSKIKRVLPGYQAKRDAHYGAEQFRKLFERIDMSPETFNSPPYTRLKMLNELVRTAQLDGDFKWSAYDFS